MQGKAFLGAFKTAAPQFVFATSDRFDETVDRLRAVRHGSYKYIRNFNPSITNALPNSYREQMAMMQNMRALWEANALPQNVGRWFATPKPQEELYDITADPYELNNLADDPSLQDTLALLRNRLDQWMVETADMGRIPEQEILKQFFPEGKPPTLQPLTAKTENQQLVLHHENPGSTIIWQKEGDSLWSIYTAPLSKDLKIKAKAVRIGYNPSEMFSWP